MKVLVDILRIARLELHYVLHDMGVLLFVLFMPLGYPLIYSLIYTNETVCEVPVVVWDECDSPESRALLRRMDATREARITARVSSLAEAQEHLAEDAFCFVRIPADFSRRLARGRQPTVGLYADMGSMMYYKSLLSALSGAMSSAAPSSHGGGLKVDAVPLYNPQGGFAAFLVPPVLMLIIQQSMMLGVGMAAGCLRQRWRGRLLPGRLGSRLSARRESAPLIVAGRASVYFCLYLLMAVYMCIGVTRWFGLPQLAHYGTFIAYMVPYVLACVFFALTCSGFIYRREDCILLFVFFSAPLLFLSGISWPGAAMPEFWRAVSCLFPSSPGINGYVRIASMGASIADVLPEYTLLWMQAAAYFLTACLLYRRDGRQGVRQPHA